MEIHKKCIDFWTHQPGEAKLAFLNLTELKGIKTCDIKK